MKANQVRAYAAAALAQQADRHAEELKTYALAHENLSLDYSKSCELVAKMHEAALGEVRGPIIGVVEDVAALRAQVVRHVEEIAAYAVTVSNRDAEIARMRTELHQHECNNFEAVREQRDFLLASQTLLIESAKAGQDAQAAEIANLRAQRVRGEPVAWMHSKTGCVSVSPYDLSLADGDETAIPLYKASPLSEAEIQDLRDRAIGMLEKPFPQPERKPAHTEAEVQDLLLHRRDGDANFVVRLRRILGVPAQGDK